MVEFKAVPQEAWKQGSEFAQNLVSLNRSGFILSLDCSLGV